VAVLIEALNVIVRVETLNELFPGGETAYAQRCPNATYCNDGVLTRVGFMTPRDVQLFTGALQRLGFAFLDDAGGAVDFVVIDEREGPTTPCAWVEFAEGELIAAAWLRGSGTLADVHCPPGWKPREEPLTFVPNAEAGRLEPLGRRGPTDVYFDRELRQTSYVGSPFRDGVVPFEDLPSAPLPADSH
jgi:hypothetical protein